MAFGTVCKNTETQENEAWIIAGPTDGSTNIVHHDNNNNYQLLTGIDDQYGAGYTGITCCCKPLFNPATGLLTVDCACTTTTCVDIDTLDNSGVNHPVLFQMYDSVNSELINKLGKSTSVMFNPNCYVCNDPDTGAQICKPVLYVSTICSDEYLGIAEPISYVNSLPVKPENKIYGIQESDTISSMTIKTLARTYFDFDSTNNVYIPKQNLIETDLTIGLSTDVDIQTINSSFTEVNGSIVVTPETTVSGTLTLQRFYAGESTSCNYFKLGSGDGGSGTVEINRQSYSGYKLVASDANGENLRISGPTVTADDQNFDIALNGTNSTLTDCKSAARHIVCVRCDSTHYSSVEQQKEAIIDHVESGGTYSDTTKYPHEIYTVVKHYNDINCVNEITNYNCKEINAHGDYNSNSQFKALPGETEIKSFDNSSYSSISTNITVNPDDNPEPWINQESYIEKSGTIKCIQTQLLPKCDKPIWSTYHATTDSGATWNTSSVAFCCDGKVYVNCDETKGWKCLLNEDDIPDATTICPSDTNCEFPLTFYDYTNTTFLTSCNGKLTYNPGTNTVEMGDSADGMIKQHSCQPAKNGRSDNEIFFRKEGPLTIRQSYDCSNVISGLICEVSITECKGCIELCAHEESTQNYGSFTRTNIAGGSIDICYSSGNSYCHINGCHFENGGGMRICTTCAMGSSTYGQDFRVAVMSDTDCPNPETFSYSYCDRIRCTAFKLCNCDGKMYVNCDSTKGWKCLLNEDEASSGGTYISWTNPTTSSVNSITTENGIVGQSYGSINLAIPGSSEFYADATCMTVDKKNIGSLQIRDNGVCLDSLGGTLHLDQSGNVTLAAKTGCPGGAVIADRFTSDGTASIHVSNNNELNITPGSGTATWINYRGGASIIYIGDGSGTNAFGTLCAGRIVATTELNGPNVSSNSIYVSCWSVAAGTNLPLVKAVSATAGQGYRGGAYLGHLNAAYDGYWGFATVGYYNDETGAVTPNICMAREGYVFFNNGISSTNAHVDTCLYGPYGKIDFATNNRIEIEPAAGSGGSVMWGPGQCGYFFINSSGEPSVYPAPGTNFVVAGNEVVNTLYVCETPYKLKNGAWCPLAVADEVVPVSTANGTTFQDNANNTWFERHYGGRTSAQVVLGNDDAHIYGSNGACNASVFAGGECAYIISSSQASSRKLTVTPTDVYITASGLSTLHFANGGCETTYQGMSMGNPNAFILANMAPQNIVIPVASTGSTDLGNGFSISDYVGTLVVSDTGRALFNFAGIMGGQPAIGMYTYKATNIGGTWVWAVEKGFTQ